MAVRRRLVDGEGGAQITQDESSSIYNEQPGPYEAPDSLAFTSSKPKAPVLPGLPPPDDARSGETPRERIPAPVPPPSGPVNVPQEPQEPQPQAGMQMSIPPPGPVPFEPLPSEGPGVMTQIAGLMGGGGGPQAGPLAGLEALSTSSMSPAMQSTEALLPSPAFQTPRRQRGALFGSQGGLKGGGLGVPLDPVANQQSDPIATLIKLLNGGQ
jgi:hypothetical protein